MYVCVCIIFMYDTCMCLVCYSLMCTTAMAYIINSMGYIIFNNMGSFCVPEPVVGVLSLPMYRVMYLVGRDCGTHPILLQLPN